MKTGSGSAIFNGNMSGLDNVVLFHGLVRTDGWNPWKDGLRLSVNGLGVFELWNTAVTVGELTGSGIIRNSANWSGYAGGAAIAVNNLTVQSGNFGGVITDNGYGNGEHGDERGYQPEPHQVRRRDPYLVRRERLFRRNYVGWRRAAGRLLGG